MKGIYHSKDLDGFTSAAIFKLKFPDIELIGYDYGDNFDFKIEKEPVIIADVSFPIRTMIKFALASDFNLTWIDHHVSAIKEYNDFINDDNESYCTAVLEIGIAACEGTWKYLFPNKKLPEAVLLLGEYDTWRNSDKDRWNNKILPFQYGMRLICNKPEKFPVELFENNNLIDKIIEDGKIILKYQDSVNQKLCKSSSFEADFQGKKAICLNGGGFNSDVFKSVYDEDKHDVMLPFIFDGKKWNFSIYTTKNDIDCSVIAKKLGGGGHKQAAGFSVDDISSIFPNFKK